MYFSPTIGSVVEGSPLARLSHPDMKNEMEIEADVMYVVGCIRECDAEDAIQVFSLGSVTKMLKSNRKQCYLYIKRTKGTG